MVNKTVVMIALVMSLAFIAGCKEKPNIEGKIVFVKYAQIYKLSNNKIRRLTNQGKNIEPEISPDGKEIVFTSLREGNNETEIYLMNIDGTNVKQISHFIKEKGKGIYPRWKDDDLIMAAYSVNIENVILDKDGNQVEEYWNPGVNNKGKEVLFNGLARFSPDKKYRLAYSIFGGMGRYIRIIKSEDEEHGQEIISLYPNVTSPDPRFSPDSQKVLYTDGGDIKYFDIPAMKEVLVKKGEKEKIRYMDPCWSPDGKQIAVSKIYSYLWGFYQRSYVVIMNIDGSNEQTISRGGQPDWGK